MSKYENMDDVGMDGDEPKKFSGGMSRKKQCRFCTDSEMILDYKNVRLMGSFLTEHGKIVPQRISGNCALHQRRLTSAIKRARQIALLGYINSGI